MFEFLAWTTQQPDTGSKTDPVAIVVYTLSAVILVGTLIAVAVILWRGRKNRNKMKDDMNAAEPEETEGVGNVPSPEEESLRDAADEQNSEEENRDHDADRDL